MKPVHPAVFVLLAFVVVPCLGAGCDDSSPPGRGDAGADAGVAAPLPASTGLYRVESDVQLPATLLAPQGPAMFVETLAGFRKNPAATLVKLLDQAGVPLLNDLYRVLPDALTGQVDDAINDYVNTRTVMGRPLTSEIDAIVSVATQSLTSVVLLTDLQLPEPGDAGALTAHHALTGVRYDFRLNGLLIPVLLPSIAALPGTPFVKEASAPWSVAGGGAAVDARLAVGDHVFGLPIGTYAWQGLNEVTRLSYGADLRGTLAVLVDCQTFATKVGASCVGPLCIGNESTLRAICDKGIDLMASKARAELEAANLETVRFKAGTADLHDAPAGGARDGLVDVLANGRWDMALDAGQGPRATTAAFTGKRAR